MNLHKHKNTILITFIIILFVFSSVFLVNYLDNKKQKEKNEREEFAKIQKLENLRKNLEALDLEAKAVSIYNITEDKFFYGKNQNLVLPIASLAKIGGSLFVLQDNNLNEIEITKRDLEQLGNNDLYEGEKWQKSDLIPYTLISSSNDAMHALGSGVEFIKKLNRYIEEIGFSNTSFRNSTGLDIWPEGIVGAESTATEINLLAVRAFKAFPDIFSQTANVSGVYESISGTKHEALNTNYYLSTFPNVVFSKTGYTNLSGGNLIIIFKNKNEDLISVSLLGSTREGRFTDMQKIIYILYN